MRVRTLLGVFVCSLLFAGLLTATRASSMPLEKALVGATLAPTWTNFQPTGWVRSNLVTCTVDVDCPSGLTGQGGYDYSTDGGRTWHGEIALTFVPNGNQGTLIVSNLSLPSSLYGRQNLIKFSVGDSGGIVWRSEAYVDPYAVMIDANAPTSFVSTSGCYNSASWPGKIDGTASDVGSGVRSVMIALQDSGGFYYNGSNWQTGELWLDATGTSTWSYPIILPQGSYTVHSRATDWAGNVQNQPEQKTFSYDISEPQSSIDTAACFNAGGTWPGVISGSASDAFSAVASVQVTVQRASDGLYYDGSTWMSNATWLAAAGTTSWSLPFVPPEPTTYTVRVRAVDDCGNVQSTPTERSFSYDTNAPDSSIATTGCYSTVNVWPGAITGLASDVGSGVASVQITLQRSSDGQYFDGQIWVSSLHWIMTSGTTAWSFPFSPPGSTDYWVQSRAIDFCGNVQPNLAQGLFSYDTAQPQSTISTEGFLNVWPGAITGTASDVGSGVANVQLTLRRASDGFYFDGASWSSTQPVWIMTSGTTAWSLSLTAAVETTYTVKSKAVDGCGNEQSPAVQTTFTYDATAPAKPTNLVSVPSGWTNVNVFSLTWSNPQDVSGVTRVHFKWDAMPNSATDEASGSPAEASGIHSLANLQVPVQGTHRLYIWLEDAVGNVDYHNWEATPLKSFDLDMVAPQTSIAGLAGNQGCGGWYTSTVQVTPSVVDINPDPLRINETSGVSVTYWRKDNDAQWRVLTSTMVITGEGTHSVSYYSVDRAGNQEGVQSLTPQIKIDTLPPTTTPSFDGARRNGWYVSPITVSLAVNDDSSGVATTYYQVDDGAFQSGNAFVVTGDGMHTIRYYSVDIACNAEKVQTAVEKLQIDRTAPTTVARVEGLPSCNGWFHSSPVTVTLHASDAVTGVQTSGLDTLRYRIDDGNWQPYSSSDTVVAVYGNGAHTLQYYASDLAGNVEMAKSLSVGIDLVPPATINHVPIVSPAGWTKTNCFSIRWDENPSDISGIGGVYYSFTEPTSPTDGTLVEGDSITSIPCVQVPPELGDGAHELYLWLRDKACNSDQLTRREVTLRLDRVPPQPAIAVAGSSSGTSGWYNSCITATFVATDVHSGMATGVISYQVNGTGWGMGTVYSTCEDRLYTIESQAMDSAGNASDVITRYVKLDKTAPLAPERLQVAPASWSKNNAFTLTWSNPGDLSGVAGVYYKVGSLPTSSTDGTFVEGYRSSLVISATAEGRIPVYLWLADRAGNKDYHNRADTTLLYDATPPLTTFSVLGTQGREGWYTSTVRIALQCQDNDSRCSSTYYRLGDGPWQEGTAFSMSTDGTVAFSYYSADVAGNIEGALTDTVKVDRTAPSSRASADAYSQSSSFLVRWDASDVGSGSAAFNVQYRLGANGTWQNWIINASPSQKSDLFTLGQVGKTVYFRSQAIDRAGNVEPWPFAPDAYVVVDPLRNGDWERGDWTGWDHYFVRWSGWGGTTECQPNIVTTVSFSGGSTHAVLLGCSDVRDGAAVGTSMVCQTISVPAAQDMPAPVLFFRYRVLTYDVIWGPNTHKYYDSFDVGIASPGSIEPTYVFTDGNRSIEGKLLDLGWREGSIDLRPYAGQTIRVCLSNITREDSFWNTWTFVDDVRLMNLEQRLYLPAVLRVPSVSMSATNEATSEAASRGRATGR